MKDDQSSNQDDRNSADSDELSRRLEKLKEKLDGLEGSKKTAQPARDDGKDKSGIALAFRLSAEFIAGVVVGAGLGYGFDILFGTSPWGMIVFLLLGFAAAVLNVLRSAGLVAESQMRLKPAQEMHERQQNDDLPPIDKK